MTSNHVLWNDDYPLSSKYDPDWVFENQMGPNALWLTEWLCQEMDLQPGMRVLDMGCGKALSSILLAREFEGGVPEHLTRRQRSSGVFWAQDCWCFILLSGGGISGDARAWLTLRWPKRCQMAGGCGCGEKGPCTHQRSRFSSRPM